MTMKSRNAFTVLLFVAPIVFIAVLVFIRKRELPQGIVPSGKSVPAYVELERQWRTNDFTMIDAADESNLAKRKQKS